MVEAVLTESLKAEDVERRVSEFVRARFRVDHNCNGDLSLDMPAFAEGSTTLAAGSGTRPAEASKVERTQAKNRRECGSK